MAIEVPENSETGGQDESPIPALRKDLESIVDPEAQRRLEEYVSGLPTEPTESSPDWLLASTATQHLKNDDPVELVIDLCRRICEMAAASGPFVFPDPVRDKIKEIKRKTGNIDRGKIRKIEKEMENIKKEKIKEIRSTGKITRQLNGALTILKKARARSDYYSPSDGELEPISDSDIKIVEEIHNRAWRWYEYASELDNFFDLPLPEKKTTPGRPALDHVNAFEWKLWQLLQCTGMKRRIASRYIEQLLSFYDLSERPWESIEQRLIKQDKSSRG